MTARVDGEEIHPIYGTTAFVAHVEAICRAMLVPHLSPGEEGVGYQLSITHHTPARVGAQLTLAATVADVGARRVLCEVNGRVGGRLIASATFEQRVVSEEEFTAEIAALP